MKLLSLLPFVAGILASPIELEERQSPNPNDVYIVGSKTAGTGCPAGTVQTTLADDGSFVTFLFDSFVASIGPGTAVSDRTKNCQIQLDVHYPEGFQYSIFSATYHGYAALDAGVTGSFISSYFFSQSPASTASTRTNVAGPIDSTYTKTDKLAQTSVIWSPCGTSGLINANNRISLASKSASAAGILTNDDATFKFEQKLFLQWRPCRK